MENHSSSVRVVLERKRSPGSFVEIGAHSLKFHDVQGSHIQTAKFPHDLGHDVYGTGRISRNTIRRIVSLIRGVAVHPATVTATSAVRDAENAALLTRHLREELDVSMHVLSSWEEASLLARAYLARSRKLPAVVFDVGGGSVEVIFLTRTASLVWDSLPLGVIRLYQKWKAGGISAMTEWIDHHLERASIAMAAEVVACGGTVQAVAKTLGDSTFSLRQIGELEAAVRRDGPPPKLDPERARVFFPGVLLLRKLLGLVRAERGNYLGMSIGRRALEERLGADRSMRNLRAQSLHEVGGAYVEVGPAEISGSQRPGAAL